MISRVTTRIRRRRVIVAATVAVAALAGGSAYAASSSSTTTYGSGTPLVYHEVSRQNSVLGPQSNPTTLLVSPPMKAGWYEVTYSVALVVAQNDNVVCEVANSPGHNDGVFGSAGNSGTSANYGTASATDAIDVTQGQQLYLDCDSNNNAGSSTGSVSMNAMRIGKLVNTTS